MGTIMLQLDLLTLIVANNASACKNSIQLIDGQKCMSSFGPMRAQHPIGVRLTFFYISSWLTKCSAPAYLFLFQSPPLLFNLLLLSFSPPLHFPPYLIFPYMAPWDCLLSFVSQNMGTIPFWYLKNKMNRKTRH